jgi:CRP/FNR family transcriptional activator FtrB
MRKSDAEKIRALPLFREMAADHFHALAQAALLQTFPQSITLIHEGETPDFLHILIEGSVELFTTWDERETTLDIVRPVATFILAAVIRDEAYLKSARTLSQSQVLLIPADAVREVFGRDAAFARSIVNELAERYRHVVRILKDQKLRTSVQRLANWILDEEHFQGGRGRVSLKYDKRTLSSRLGMSPENLSRTLAALAGHGVLVSGRDIAIVDKVQLKRLAKPNRLIDESAV